MQSFRRWSVHSCLKAVISLHISDHSTTEWFGLEGNTKPTQFQPPAVGWLLPTRSGSPGPLALSPSKDGAPTTYLVTDFIAFEDVHSERMAVCPSSCTNEISTLSQPLPPVILNLLTFFLCLKTAGELDASSSSNCLPRHTDLSNDIFELRSATV